MNESVTFVLYLKELMSGGMAKIASVAQSTFNAVDRRVSNTQRQFNMAGRSVSELNTRLQLLTQKRDMVIGTADVVKANREIQALERRIDHLQNKGVNRNTGGGGLRMPGWMSAAAITGLVGMLTMSMIKVGADQQRDIVGLSTFMGKQQAGSYYAKVQQDARVTPFVTHDLMQANRMLISTGMNADRARRDIMNLANAVAATGGSNYQLERMAQHLQMIRGMGHASYMQLKEFTTNGINIMQLLSDATGKHIKMAHGMTVSYNAIENALDHAAQKGGLFYNALFAQSQTIWGKWSTLVDDLQVSAGQIVSSQSAGITGLLDLFDRYAQRLPAMASQWGGAITNIVQHIIALVGTLIDMAKWLYHNWSWVKYLVGVFIAFRAAVWLATTATGLYNTAMSIAAYRVSAFAIAETEATTAAVALDAAMSATPWGAIALGVAGVGVAITALISQSKNAGKQITDNLNPNITKGISVKPAEPTMADYYAGNAVMKTWGGYRWKDYRDYPLTASEQARLDALGGRKGDNSDILNRYGKRAMMEKIMEDRRIADARQRANAFVTMPNQGMSGAAKMAKDAAPEKEEGDGINSGSITGGGGRKVYINFRNFTEHFSINVKDWAEARNMTEEQMEEWFLKMLQSAKAAL